MLQVSVHDVAGLAAEFDVPDLADRLRSAGVPVLTQSDRHLVIREDWAKFVRDAIHAHGSLNPVGQSVYLSVTPAASLARDDDVATADEGEGWGNEQMQRFARFPHLKLLVNQFTVAVRQRFNAPHQQHSGTRTFLLPGRRVGLELRAASLFIYRLRGGVKRGIDIRSEADFEQALDWMETA